MSDIKALKEQAKKEREKKAAAQAAVQSYRFSKDITFNLKPRQANDESFLSKSVKHVLGDFGAFKTALHGNKTQLYLGIDNSVPGTPEVIEFDSDSPFHGYVNDLLKPKNGINHPPPIANLINTVNGDVNFTQPTNKNANNTHPKKGTMKPKPPKLKMNTKEPEGIKTPNKIESIIKEMTQGLAPPLSDIETPGKLSGDNSNRFTFPKSTHGKDMKNEDRFTEVMSLVSRSETGSSKGSSIANNDFLDTELGKVISLSNGPDKQEKSSHSVERKLSSSSTSSSDDSSSDSSASSDSEDEQQKAYQRNVKEIASMNLNSSLLSELKPNLTRNADSPLNNNNNYLLDKTSLNGPIKLENNNTSVLSYQNNITNNLTYQEKSNHSLDMGKTNLKTDPSLIANDLFDPVESWGIEKPISPLANGLFADLYSSFPGPEEENFVDDIFKADDDITKEASVMSVSTDTKKDDSFTKDSVFDSDLERSLPKPCLPRRGSLYRKDSEQTDGRNKSSSKSNETKDKSKSKTTRIDSSSFPSVKVNSGSMGYPCPTKAQLKAPVRKHSLSESSSTSADEVKTIRKTKDKNYKLNQEKMAKKDKSLKKERFKMKLESIDDDQNKLDPLKLKMELSNTSPSLKNTSPRQKRDPLKSKTELIKIQTTVGKVIASVEEDDDVSEEQSFEEKSQTLLNVKFEENLKSTISPMISPIHSSSDIASLINLPMNIKANFSLDLPGDEKQAYISEVSHGMKPLISPIKDLLSPIKDNFETEGNFHVEHESIPMDIEDDSESRQPEIIVCESKPLCASDPFLSDTPETLAPEQPIKTELIVTTDIKEEENQDSRNCLDAFQDHKQIGSGQLKIRIPLKLIKLKYATLSNCEIRNADVAENSKPAEVKTNDDCDIDVENITDSPVKRKRKLSEESSLKNDDTIFKSPRDVTASRLIVRIDLSKLKRHPGRSPDNLNVCKQTENKGNKKRRVSTESNLSIKVESPSEKISVHNESIDFSLPSISVKEEENDAEDGDHLKQEVTQSSSSDNNLKLKRSRGRPSKTNKPSAESLAKNPSEEKNIVKPIDNRAEPTDGNVCHECGTLRKESGRDTKVLASYKKIYSTFLNEGRRVKHVADCLTNPVERAHTYIDAVLYYIQYLIGLDSSGKLGLKQGLDEYSQIASECIRLVDYVISRYGRKIDSATNTYDRRFLFLCLRLQSMLYLKLFNVRKESAMKYSKVISEYYKQYKPVGNPDPSPHHKTAQNRGSTGTPSPSSPGPSPSSSVASIGSAGSSGSAGSNEKVINGGSAAFVSIPTDMHGKTFQYMQYTKYLLHAHRLWDDAELLTIHCHVFLSNLSRKAGILAMQSSMLHVVEYVKAGLRLIKDNAPS